MDSAYNLPDAATMVLRATVNGETYFLLDGSDCMTLQLSVEIDKQIRHKLEAV